MVAAFPAAKLGALLIKQVSKPLANAMKRRAKTSPFFRTYICMPPAQFYHWCEVKLKMWSMNIGKPVNIPKLNEAMAIELGAELVGETVIFSIAAAILIAEYVRSSRKEAMKEEERKEELARIQSDLRELYFKKAELEAQVRELIRILHVNIPASNFHPQEANMESIPAHHREEPEQANDEGFFSSVKGLIWSAVDYIVPAVDDSTAVAGKDSKKTTTTEANNNVSQSNVPQQGAPSTSTGGVVPANNKSDQVNNTSSKR